MESSRLDLFIDMVVDRFIFKNNQITHSYCFTFQPKVCDYLKNRFASTVILQHSKSSGAKEKEATQRGAEQTSNSHQRDARWASFRR